MSPSHVSEPTYRAIKERLKAGIWAPGARLEAMRLADDLGVSMTPVRDCLNRLAGERMVELVASDGFRVIRLTEQRLKDMLSFKQNILLQALDQPSIALRLPDGTGKSLPHGEHVSQLFVRIAAAGNNSEALASARSLNDRLYLSRSNDRLIFKDADLELQTLEDLILRGEFKALRQGLIRYHRRRRAKAVHIIHLLDSPSS